MNKRGLVLTALLVFCSSSLSFAQMSSTSDDFKMPPNVAPVITQVMGDQRVDLPRSKWPKIESCQGTVGCCSVVTRLSEQYREGQSATNFQPMADLTISNFVLKPEYKTTSKILVTWTVRVVAGGAAEAYTHRWAAGMPDATSCVGFSGYSLQTVIGGLVKTALFVNGVQKSSVASLVFPSSEPINVIQPPPPPPVIRRDPTITGSYVLSKEDFGGSFPEPMKIEIRFQNDTAWGLVSLPNQHNIVITEFPVTKE